MPRIDLAAADRFWAKRALKNTEGAGETGAPSKEAGPVAQSRPASTLDAPPTTSAAPGNSAGCRSPAAGGVVDVSDVTWPVVALCREDGPFLRPSAEPAPASAPSAVEVLRDLLVASVPPVALPPPGRRSYRREDGARMVEIRPGEFVSARAYEVLTGRAAP